MERDITITDEVMQKNQKVMMPKQLANEIIKEVHDLYGLIGLKKKCANNE